MLSYRHAFHAGNHADVLKHAVVVQLLHHLAQKDKAFWYIDTHAGAGVYSLADGYATKTGEFETGIAKIWGKRDLPGLLKDYVKEVKALNADGTLQFYPGSPYLAWRSMREQDRMRLFELHSTEIDVLRHNFRDAGRRAVLFEGDGFDGIIKLLPPPPRRALVLIDPSYEDKRDYARTLNCLEESLKRFRDRHVRDLVSAGDAAGVAAFRRSIEARTAQELAACFIDREQTTGRWLWAIRERHVYCESALHASG